MAKYSKKHAGNDSKNTKPAPSTIETAEKIAKGSKKEGQSKQQTKLISIGIQKGIEQYKKQEKSKAKEIDKKNKKRTREKQESSNQHVIEVRYRQHWLPWALLLITWLAIIAYFLIVKV